MLSAALFPLGARTKSGGD